MTSRPTAETRFCSDCRTAAPAAEITITEPAGGSGTRSRTIQTCRRCLPHARRLFEALGFAVEKGTDTGANEENGHTPPRVRIETLPRPAGALPLFGAKPAAEPAASPAIGHGGRRAIAHRMTRLERDLVVMDAEWTGGAAQNAVLISLAIQRLRPDGTGYETSYTVNPQVPISDESRTIHGISDAMVKDLPSFAQYAHQVKNDLAGADVAGYGVRNDVTIVEKALSNSGVTWKLDDVKLVDPLRIWQKGEPRALVNAHEAFVGSVPTVLRAHDARDDVRMTVSVIEALASDLTAAEVQDATDPGLIDPAGKFIRREDGEILLNFAAHRDQPARNHLDFLEWMLRKDFAPSSRAIARAVIEASQKFNEPQKKEDQQNTELDWIREPYEQTAPDQLPKNDTGPPF